MRADVLTGKHGVWVIFAVYLVVSELKPLLTVNSKGKQLLSLPERHTGLLASLAPHEQMTES